MHYYQFNISDYRSSTAHLSNEEDLAYRRLIDMYYDTEQKISLDTQLVAKRLRVNVDAVNAVLVDKFAKHEDGWFHVRCDEVIKHYHQMAEVRRVNGRLGGRKKNLLTTEQVPSTNQAGTEHQPEAKLTNNQELITNNQELNLNTYVKSTDVDVDQWNRISCPVKELVNIFHEECTSLPKVMMLNDQRKKLLVARWVDVAKVDNITSRQEGLDIFRAIFQQVERSDFLCGRTKDSRHWKANFDFLVKSTNFLRISEGQFDNGRN